MSELIENHVHIDNMIREAFSLLKLTYDYHNAALSDNTELILSTTGSRLIFPKDRNGEVRVSEQELRFAFVEVFNRYVKKNGLNWFYSVEMPTQSDYGFSGDDKRNALFDMAIVDSHFKRIALIEFKANNPQKECYEKDIKKLANPEESDDDTLKYFLQIVKNHNTGTEGSIMKKTQLENPAQGMPIHLRVFSLLKNEEIINKIIEN